MKKLFLFAEVMFSSISFSSCSEDGNKESQTSQKLLKQIEEISADKTIYYDFSYDDQQRLAEAALANLLGDHRAATRTVVGGFVQYDSVHGSIVWRLLRLRSAGRRR